MRLITGSRLLFTFQVPSLLPPTSQTVFDRTSHTLVASVLESAPEYALGPVPEYDDFAPAISPRGSISSLSDWSFSGTSTRRSSLLSESCGSRRGSVNSRRSSVSSSLGDGDNGSRRGSVESPSRRGSADSGIGEVADSKKKKGLFGGFRRKSSTTSLETKQAEKPAPKASSAALVSSVEPNCNGIRLAEWLLPSTSANTTTLEIVSCPTPRGEICAVDWAKNSDTAGLGRSQKHLHSDIVSLSASHSTSCSSSKQFSLGSGVNFEYKLQDIPANTTVHTIRLSLCQKTKASNGDSEEEIFELFSRGCSQMAGGKVLTEEHVWRGEESRTWDAQPAKPSKSDRLTPKTARPQVSLPNVTSTSSSLRIRSKVRLPTPIVGAVPSSPKLLDNRLARTVHRLRIETFFSVLGEDGSGGRLSPDPKSKNGRPREGTLKRTWVDHDVVIGSCCITPENVLVPRYTESPDLVLGEAQQKAKLQSRESISNFEMVTRSTHTIKKTSGDQMTERIEKLPSDAKERLSRHSCESDSRCLCFHGDSVIAGMIGNFEKAERDETLLPQLLEIGGALVKSLYEPIISVDCPPPQTADLILPPVHLRIPDTQFQVVAN